MEFDPVPFQESTGKIRTIIESQTLRADERRKAPQKVAQTDLNNLEEKEKELPSLKRARGKRDLQSSQVRVVAVLLNPNIRRNTVSMRHILNLTFRQVRMGTRRP